MFTEGLAITCDSCGLGGLDETSAQTLERSRIPRGGRRTRDRQHLRDLIERQTARVTKCHDLGLVRWQILHRAAEQLERTGWPKIRPGHRVHAAFHLPALATHVVQRRCPHNRKEPRPNRLHLADPVRRDLHDLAQRDLHHVLRVLLSALRCQQRPGERDQSGGVKIPQEPGRWAVPPRHAYQQLAFVDRLHSRA